MDDAEDLAPVGEDTRDSCEREEVDGRDVRGGRRRQQTPDQPLILGRSGRRGQAGGPRTISTVGHGVAALCEPVGALLELDDGRLKPREDRELLLLLEQHGRDWSARRPRRANRGEKAGRCQRSRSLRGSQPAVQSERRATYEERDMVGGGRVLVGRARATRFGSVGRRAELALSPPDSCSARNPSIRPPAPLLFKLRRPSDRYRADDHGSTFQGVQGAWRDCATGLPAGRPLG